LYQEQRHSAIVERARRTGRVDVAELATEFDVTPETVRRDLTALERRGVLRRVHGGAIPAGRQPFEPALPPREAAMADEEQRIPAAALAELPAEGAILLDVAFLGANRVSLERGLTTPDPAEAAVKRAMLAAARRAIVLADHTKFATDCFARFGVLEQVDTLISDSGLDVSLAADLQAAGPRVVLA
jgi:DeoR/GlpR family transcriptional regulator of sugar metabolism